MLGKLISERLASIIGRAEIISVRGYGLGILIDFSDSNAAQRFVKVARGQRVFVYACGSSGNVIKLYPPYTITEAEACQICDTIESITNMMERQ